MNELDGFLSIRSGRWFEALESYDAVASYSTGSTVGCADGSHPSILTWLSRCSLYRTVADLAGRYSGPEVREHQFECAWRLGQVLGDCKLGELHLTWKQMELRVWLRNGTSSRSTVFTLLIYWWLMVRAGTKTNPLNSVDHE